MKPTRYAKGAVAGIVATVPMTAAMELARRRGLVRRLPPEEITDRMLASAEATGATRDERQGMAGVVHMATGATLGAMFAVLPLPRRLMPRIALGATYGAAVYTVNYFGIAPKARLMPPPSEDRTERQVTTFVAHLVFGVTLACLLWPRRKR